jgi:chemotaxis protein MotA
MKSAANRSRLDFATWAGVVLVVCGLLGGFMLEGGTPQAIIGESAALIVFGGCIGATLVAHPLSEVLSSARALSRVFLQKPDSCEPVADEIMALSRQARKTGLVSLETMLDTIEEPILRKGIMLGVDGVEPETIREILEVDIDVTIRHRERDAQVLESAGGFSPTIGIIGAVLGLIVTMGRIDDTKLVGRGIASAFVATVYGVGFANLFLLPAAAKLRSRAARERERMELMLLGSLALAEGLNTKLLQDKIECFVRGSGAAKRVSSPTYSAAEPESQA